MSVHELDQNELQIDLPIAADHPSFAGHFPGHPVVPGVLLLDLALQAMAQWQEQLHSATSHDLGHPWGKGRLVMPVIKFSSPLRPAELPRLQVKRQADGSLRFDIRCAQRAVAQGAVSWQQDEPA